VSSNNVARVNALCACFVFCADAASDGFRERFQVVTEKQDCVHLEDEGSMVRVGKKPSGCSTPAVSLDVGIGS
jgi:hypothetical protein